MCLTPPMNGFPVEFGIGVRGPKCLNDGHTRWSKKFSDRFSRFDTIPAVTGTHPASQPPSHPASHVAVAITLNALAKASSLKTTRVVSHVGLSPVSLSPKWLPIARWRRSPSLSSLQLSDSSTQSSELSQFVRIERTSVPAVSL